MRQGEDVREFNDVDNKDCVTSNRVDCSNQYEIELNLGRVHHSGRALIAASKQYQFQEEIDTVLMKLN